MTSDKNFKALVRERMRSHGENYTTARAALVAQAPPPSAIQTSSGSLGADDPDPYYARTVRTFFDGPRLRSIPTKRRARVVVLLELLRGFERGRDYAEVEVNDRLRVAHPDVASLRRELVDYRLLLRAGGVYRVTDEAPARGRDEAQEVPADEAERIARIPVATVAGATATSVAVEEVRQSSSNC